MNWYIISSDEALQKTGGQKNGLDDSAVEQKRAEHGRNELQVQKKKSALMIFVHQFLDVMILVLVAAAVISSIIGEVSDTIVIFIIIVLNAVIGFVQEYRAEKAMEALQKMSTPNSMVLRNGNLTQIPSAEIVPGDIVEIEAGNTVPADLRLLEVHSLKINEASLTGESNAIDKTTDPLKDGELALGDQTNIAFKGTHITNGRGRGLVIATGMKTELGKIAGMLQTATSSTPLQKRLSDFSRKLTFIIIGLCVALFLVGYLRGEEFNRMLLTSISLAVAAIPEALPAVVTVALAIGAKRMTQQNALIRKLYAVETLGSVTFVCTDKTGTLTKNEMTVQKIWTVEGQDDKTLLHLMSLNHDVKKDGDKITGDPTEIAMVKHAKEQEQLERVDEIPFDADRKAMTTIHKKDGGYWVVTKGAAEGIAAMSNDKGLHETLKAEEEKFANEGMRVIGFAVKEMKEMPSEMKPELVETDMEFIGLVGLIDPPREEAKDAIKQCKTAGIIPVMITGDHPLTAATIAKQIGIIDKEEHKVLTGKELASMDKEEYKKNVAQIRVYARVSPEQKLQIVETLQDQGQFVSMTGDGVNDAPSLKKANIGVAMGITGTDVTKEASHMILLDDNFATIVKAVREGRRIYDNIRKFIKYIMTGNAAEIWSIFLAPLLGLPIPLLPVHILWVNLVTDGLPALALAAEPAEKSIMQRPPRKTNESIFANGLGVHIIWVGIFIGLLTIGTQWYALHIKDTHWQTLVFTVLCFSQLWHVMAIRSETQSLFRLGLFTNKALLLSVFGTVLLQLAVIYVPQLNEMFHTQPLTGMELFAAFAVSSIVWVVVEIEKAVKRKRIKAASRQY